MHFRLKRRIAYYTFILVIMVLLGKIMISEKNTCTTLNPHEVSLTDLYNINEHHVELDKREFIERSQKSLESQPALETRQTDDWGPHKLGLIIPYRSRFEELKEFVPYMENYLNKKKIRHKIYVINQVDSHRFNRASLINIGFLIARNESCDYIAMHDVDLLPLNPELNYGYPKVGPFHVAAPHLHPKYHYKNFVGGILLVSVEHYESLNGMSNMFWGWGREDDEFFMRIVDQGYEVIRHGDEIKTGYETFRHIHGRDRKRDYAKLPGQREAMFKRDVVTGLHDVNYVLKKRQELGIDGSHASVIDVIVNCNVELTPWCDMPKSKRKKQ